MTTNDLAPQGQYPRATATVDDLRHALMLAERYLEGYALHLQEDMPADLELALQPLAYFLANVRDLKRDLASVERTCEQLLVANLPERLLPVEGVGVLEVTPPSTRRTWDRGDALVGDLLRELAVTDDGEVAPERVVLLRKVQERLVAAINVTGSAGWRTTALKALGLKPDDYCEVVHGDSKVRIVGGAK